MIRLTTFSKLGSIVKIGSIVCILSLLMLFLVACNGGSSTQSSTASNTPSSFQMATKTSDGAFQIQFGVTPDHLGLNTFTVRIADVSSGKAATNVQVSLSTTMLDMDMGTDIVSLQSNGQGRFTAQGDLSMSGHWEIRIQVRTPDHVLHEATVKLSTSA